jgi:hypothetical protein
MLARYASCAAQLRLSGTKKCQGLGGEKTSIAATLAAPVNEPSPDPLDPRTACDDDITRDPVTGLDSWDGRARSNRLVELPGTR